MKTHLTFLRCAALAAFTCIQPLSLAKEEGKETEEPRVVQAHVAKLETVHGKINPKADYYIYLGSASTCPPCRALMPKVVKEYSKMKRKNVELILVGNDKTVDLARAYAEEYKVKFPSIHYTKSGGLPGKAAASGIPNATIVDADGNAIASGHGSIILDWRKTISKHEKDQKRAAAKAAREAKKEAAAKAAAEKEA